MERKKWQQYINEFAILTFSAFTGPKNAHLVPAANKYVQVDVLAHRSSCFLFLIQNFGQ